ncbi:MAG: HesA/MoeB/ThiF family protein, partial [Candidatus Kariarchaeaceae archaeon]
MVSNFYSGKFSDEEQVRLDRQLRLPGWNQAALKDSIVLLAGIGGLGTEIAKNLAMAGVGTLHLIDMDTIEHSNLNRQILFLDGDEGEPKAVIAARMLKRINPHGTYHAYHTSLEELDPVIYEQADLYIAGLDSVKARQELNRRAVLNAKPLIDGGTSTYHGHIYSYIPKQNACLN